MPYRNVEPISKQLTLLTGLPIVGIMAFSLFYSFYQNLLFEKTLQELEDKNRQIAENIEQGYRDIEYYRSSQYKDKIAKENLGLLNPGEKILLITETTTEALFTPQSHITPTERQEATFREILRQMPIIEHWKLFLLHREKIEEMKRSL